MSKNAEEVVELPQLRIAAAGALILERGMVGYVWLDADLVVIRRSGRLTDWIEPGQSYVGALPMLVGYESALAELRRSPERSTILPNVGLQLGEGSPPKFDMQVFWQPDALEYLVVLCHESSQSALQLELHREVALRQVAEAREVELARAVSRANVELTRANRDLEEFAYVISHDLRAPLRALRMTADLLEADMTSDIGDEAREHLSRIRSLSRRMASMMSGLLEYARVGRKKEALATVDLGRLAAEIIAGIGAPPGLRIEMRGDWPVVTTLAEPLDVVLRNLVENAVKHHDTKQGTIALVASEAGPHICLEIVDDGPGIDPAYHSAIFEPFRTVSDESLPESSGIGLALVKKTADVVGGRIEVRSEPSVARGTTFRLFWPRVISID